ncbi:hypothetical protein BURMUCF2_2156 [Burkholderia multivorans CF2]|nr:hypothetical protein BURMUCF2_2156 [Burkholderia multivorans CF2]
MHRPRARSGGARHAMPGFGGGFPTRRRGAAAACARSRRVSEHSSVHRERS